MKKTSLTVLGLTAMLGMSAAVVGINYSSFNNEYKEARAEGATTYTVTFKTEKAYWRYDSAYFYFEYKEGSTKEAPAFPGIKMDLTFLEGNSSNYYWCTFTPEDEVGSFYFNDGTTDAYHTTDPIAFFTDHSIQIVDVNAGSSGSHFEIGTARIDFVENNATLQYKDITFQPWINPHVWPTVAGNYYLATDVEIIDEWTLPEGETSLLLNGHSVTNCNSSKTRYFYVDENSTFNLYDNSEEKHTYHYEPGNYRKIHYPIMDSTYNEENASKGFVLTGGYIFGARGFDNDDYKNPGKGGAIYNAGTFNMYGGTIISCLGVNGGSAVYNDGTFNMYGGRFNGNDSSKGAGLLNAGTATIMKDASIDDNYASREGGGIFNGGHLILDNATITNNASSENGAGIVNAIVDYDSTELGKITLKGKVVVSGNTSNGSENNIYIPEIKMRDFETHSFITKKGYLTIDGDKLSEGSKIGISMDNPGDFSTGLSKAKTRANIEFFTSDNSNYSVYRNVETNQLSLIEGTAPVEPTHEHVLTYAASGATITATCSAEECDLENNQATLTLQAPANLVYDGSAKAATLEDGYDTSVFPNPSIKYYQGAAEVTSCVNVGTYQAKVTYDTATAVVEFSITKADLNPAPEAVSDQKATYGDSLSDIELPDGWTWNAPTDKVGNVGTRVHKATFTPEDPDNYNIVEQDVNVIVAKADPEYVVPTGLKALHDKTLSTVTLPTGWSWEEPTTNVGSELGNKVFKATFTPADTDNYNIVEHVDVTVEVVDHEHAWTYTANGATITASCGNPECPVTEGLTLTLEAPKGDLYYDGTAKLATLKAGYSEEAFPNVTIKYFSNNKEVNECINVGKYTAKVTFGNATAEINFEILGKTIVDPTQSAASIEIDNAVVPENITLRVEVRTDVVEKDIAEDYAKIQAKLEPNEQISKVYDVKLIQTTGGIEKEIQPSDIKPGLKITVKMAIPEGIDINNVRILHIHNVNDMEFVSNYKVDGNDIVFEIDRLSQFAFINKVETGFPGWAIALIVIGGLLLLCCLFIIILFFIRPKYTIDYTKKKVIRVIITRKHDNMLLLRDVRLRKIRRNEEDVYKNKDDASKALEEHLKQ